MKKVILLGALILLMSVTLVNADSSFIFKRGELINLKIPVYDSDNDPATNAVDCFLTVRYPNESIMVNDEAMTFNSEGYFNYTIERGIANVIGLYPCSVRCSDGSDSGFTTFVLEITPTGGELSTGKSITYIIAFVVGLIIFTGLLLMGLYLPGENKRDQMTGYVIFINNIKYLKLVLLGFAYLTSLVIVYFAYILSYSYLDFNFLTNLFKFLYYTEAIMTLPLFILFMYLTIANLVRDSKIKDLLSRGLRTN